MVVIFVYMQDFLCHTLFGKHNKRDNCFKTVLQLNSKALTKSFPKGQKGKHNDTSQRK